MPKAIHIANARKRDAEVAVGRQLYCSDTKTVLPDGKDKTTVKLLKHTMEYDYEVLLGKYEGKPATLEEALLTSDPELDQEVVGRILRHTHKLYVDQDNHIAYRINLFQMVYDPEGNEKAQNDINQLSANINARFPLRWTGKRFDKARAIRRFVFSRKYQLRHINGATFDFLYNMAKELQESKSMVLIGAGAKGTEPVLLTRGGQPYRGFLEGRVDNDRYLLILHLSDIELKGIEP